MFLMNEENIQDIGGWQWQEVVVGGIACRYESSKSQDLQSGWRRMGLESRWGQGRGQLHFLTFSSFLFSGLGTILAGGEPCAPWLFPDDRGLGTRHRFWIASLAKRGQPFEHLPWIRCSQHLPDISSVLLPMARPPEVSAQCYYMFDVPEKRGNT